MDPISIQSGVLLCTPAKVGDICNKCHRRPSTGIWADNDIAYAHGIYNVWCRQCMIDAQLAHARQQALAIPVLEAELEDLNGKG
jgi:hypothetical protein